MSVVKLTANAIAVSMNSFAASYPCISPSVRPAAHKIAAPSSQRCWRLGDSRSLQGRGSAWSLPRRSSAARARPGAYRKLATWSSPGSLYIRRGLSVATALVPLQAHARSARSLDSTTPMALLRGLSDDRAMMKLNSHLTGQSGANCKFIRPPP